MPADLTNTRLWEALQTLSNKERKAFKRWVQSPYFNRNERLTKLLAYLLRCLRRGELPKGPPALRAVQAGKQSPSPSQLRLACSELHRLLEQFWVHEIRAGDEVDYYTLLAKALRKRGLQRHRQKAVQRAVKAQEQYPYRHAEFLQQQYALSFEEYQEKSAGQRVTDFNLQELSDQVDLAYIAQKLRLICIALSHQTVYKADYDLGILDALLQEVRQRQLYRVPAIGLYYYGYLLIAQPGEESHFRQLKSLMLNGSSQLPLAEQRNLYLMALNYCIKKVNALREHYYQEALDLYQFALQHELLLENGQLSPFAFNNIVAIALKVGEVDWSEQFIQTYKPLLERKHQSSTVHLNQARVAYSRQHYDKALLHLQKADYKDRINNLIAKVLQLKIFYELREYDLVDAHLNALSTHIRRQRVMGYHRTNYLNMARYTRALLHLTPGNDQERAQLRQSIESESFLTEKEWLLRMLSQT